jgi:DNA-binding response OmpR family regulator
MRASVAKPTSGIREVWHFDCYSNPQPTVNHILIVDDDPAIRDVVADILRMSDYRVKTACNGAEALDNIRNDRPAAVLLDLMMPVMDGWEFLRQYTCETCVAPVPVVIMSAARDASAVARELGAHAFLGKPFEIETILAVVGSVAREALSYQPSALTTVHRENTIGTNPGLLTADS